MNADLANALPEVQQVTWNQVKDFIFDRFDQFADIKREHPQWPLDGHLLWHVFMINQGNKAEFARSIVLVTETPTRNEIAAYIQSREYPRLRR